MEYDKRMIGVGVPKSYGDYDPFVVYRNVIFDYADNEERKISHYAATVERNWYVLSKALVELSNLGYRYYFVGNKIVPLLKVDIGIKELSSIYEGDKIDNNYQVVLKKGNGRFIFFELDNWHHTYIGFDNINDREIVNVYMTYYVREFLKCRLCTGTIGNLNNALVFNFELYHKKCLDKKHCAFCHDELNKFDGLAKISYDQYSDIYYHDICKAHVEKQYKWNQIEGEDYE